MSVRRLWAAIPLALFTPGLAACGSADEGDSTTLTVYAAASLRSTFEQLGEEFEEAHDGVEVALSFAGSSDLVAQVQQGADADVFASADTASMDKLVADDLVGEGPELFAANTMQIAVAPGNPAGITSLADLAGPGVKLVVCAPEVPCGAATVRLEGAAGLDLSPVSEEQSVTDVLNKVVTGEADAGLVYRTDVTVAGDTVEGIDFKESAGVVNDYPIATVAGSDAAGLAREFMDLVLGATGQRVLAEAGFARPRR